MGSGDASPAGCRGSAPAGSLDSPSRIPIFTRPPVPAELEWVRNGLTLALAPAIMKGTHSHTQSAYRLEELSHDHPY